MGLRPLKNPHFTHARHYTSHTAILCPWHPLQLSVLPAPVCKWGTRSLLNGESPGLWGGVHAPRELRSGLLPGAALAFPSAKWEVTARLMLQGHGEDQGETLWRSTWQNCWLRAARPVKDEPGSQYLVPLLLGDSCPPLEPGITSSCPEGSSEWRSVCPNRGTYCFNDD